MLGAAPVSSHLPADGVGVVAFVGVEETAGRQALQKHRAGSAIGDLSARQQEGERATELIGERMDLGRAAAAGAADGLALLPPLPPAAQRCAFTAELSIST